VGVFRYGKPFKDLFQVRVYTKKRGEYPDFSGGIVLRNGKSIRNVCLHIHKGLLKDFGSALVWGRSTKHSPQRVGLTHEVDDEDVVQIVKKSK
jgi:uncharacterized protein